MENELTAKATVPGQQLPSAELPAGFLDMVDDLKSIVRGAHVRHPARHRCRRPFHEHMTGRPRTPPPPTPSPYARPHDD
ncbi:MULTISPECIES: hypothetical protein [Streptomyces]|uniref:hypothetical protein n=1 Tax=Streptomyces TaxID=1883 RepID=UPI000B91AA54|nr:hypothetical protein [Streptomyces sp. 2R]OXY84772.1 hypothetical protein BEH93_23120 [Streptomyces sp. 2R]